MGLGIDLALYQLKLSMKFCFSPYLELFFWIKWHFCANLVDIFVKLDDGCILLDLVLILFFLVDSIGKLISIPKFVIGSYMTDNLIRKLVYRTGMHLLDSQLHDVGLQIVV